MGVITEIPPGEVMRSRIRQVWEDQSSVGLVDCWDATDASIRETSRSNEVLPDARVSQYREMIDGRLIGMTWRMTA